MPTDAVVGIDTRTRTFHWVSSIPLGPARRRWGFIPELAGEDMDVARAKLFVHARDFFRYVPYGSHVFCEEPLALAKNPETTRLLCMAAAAVWCGLVATDRSVTWYWTNPATWKKTVLGGAPPRGAKHKPWIEKKMLEHPGFLTWLEFDKRDRGEFMVNPDLYDAWCLMTHGTSVLHYLHAQSREAPDNVIMIDGTPLTVVELDKAKRRRITAAAKDRYVVLLAEGLRRDEAAYELGLTGSRMRAEAKRDPVFAKAVEVAIEQAYPIFQDRLRNTYVRRALDPDGPPMLINNLAIVHLPEFAILRKTQLEGELGIKALPTLDTSRYTDEELETLRELLSRGERPEIEP